MSGPPCHHHPTRTASWILLVDDEAPITACNLCAQAALESPAQVSLAHVPDDVIDLSEDGLIDLVTAQQQGAAQALSNAEEATWHAQRG